MIMVFRVVRIRLLLLASPATHVLQASGWVSPFYEADGLRGNSVLRKHTILSQRLPFIICSEVNIWEGNTSMMFNNII